MQAVKDLPFSANPVAGFISGAAFKAEHAFELGGDVTIMQYVKLIFEGTIAPIGTIHSIRSLVVNSSPDNYRRPMRNFGITDISGDPEEAFQTTAMPDREDLQLNNVLRLYDKDEIPEVTELNAYMDTYADNRSIDKTVPVMRDRDIYRNRNAGQFRIGDGRGDL